MKKFKSTTGKPVRLALLSGHVGWVNTEYEELHERFHTAAYSARCVSDDMTKNKALEDVSIAKVDALVEKVELEKAIYSVFDKIVSGEIENALTRSGAPDAQVVSTYIGERLSSQKRNELWYKYQQVTETD